MNGSLHLPLLRIPAANGARASRPPGSVLRLLAAACLWLGFFTLHAPASVSTTMNEGNHELGIEFPNGVQTRYAFHPVRLTAVNGGSRPVAWQVRIREQVYNQDGLSLNPSGHVERIVVEPGRTVERNLLVAIGRYEEQSRWSRLQVVVTTPQGDTRNWSPSSRSSSSSGRVTSPALLTNEAADALRDAPHVTEDFHGRLDPNAAARDWRGFSAFSTLVLRPEDWHEMSPSVRTAVGDWARMGGHLQFIGGMPGDAPAPDVPGSPRRGLGGVHPPPDGDGNRPRMRDLPAVAAADANHTPSFAAMRLGLHTIQPWLGERGKDLLTDRFVIWPMVAVLVVFFIMITPVNLFVLAPSRRRHLLFRTIPAISLAACVLLALAVALGDGVGGRGERFVWIESRPGAENREFITQWQASRCGALARTAFTVPDAAYIAPISPPGSTVSLRVAGDRLEAGGGWFTSRANQTHFLQAARPGRGRIEWQPGGGAPHAVATFDFPLRNVYALGEDGTWWHAASMKQGERTELEPVDAEVALARIEEITEKYPHSEGIHAMARRPGHYIAFTDSPSAIESLRSIRWSDTGVVTGLLATP